MELQEPVLKAAITEIRFPPTPRFPEARATIIEGLRGAASLENWTMNEQFLQVFTEGDPSTLLQVSVGNMSASFENVDAEACRIATRRTIETAFDALGLESASPVFRVAKR